MITRPKGRGILQQRQLLIPMQDFVFLALLHYIITNHFFIAMFSDCACKISVRPELSAPQFLFYMRASFEYLLCSYTLYDPYNNLGHAIGGNTLHKKMNMILITANFQKIYLVSLFNFQADLFQNLVNRLINYRTSVFRWKNKVIQQYSDIMAFMDVFTHSPIIRTPQAAGN